MPRYRDDAKAHSVYRTTRMGVKRLLRLAVQNCLQTGWVRQTKDAKAALIAQLTIDIKFTTGAYFGVDLGAQTTANDSGSIR